MSDITMKADVSPANDWLKPYWRCLCSAILNLLSLSRLLVLLEALVPPGVLLLCDQLAFNDLGLINANNVCTPLPKAKS
ncbi:hypothetical protein Plhal304r1_c012g0046131 [Plasmopara halstedii]